MLRSVIVEAFHLCVLVCVLYVCACVCVCVCVLGSVNIEACLVSALPILDVDTASALPILDMDTAC